jgi:hypothetical protein
MVRQQHDQAECCMDYVKKQFVGLVFHRDSGWLSHWVSVSAYTTAQGCRQS